LTIAPAGAMVGGRASRRRRRRVDAGEDSFAPSPHRSDAMATFILLSTLTDEGAKTVKTKPERIKEVNKELEKLGASVKAQYAVLGPYDFVNIVEAKDTATIMRVSAELASRGSIKLMTLSAVPIEEFVRSLK
jgi:uncharacterized protein with GYD domain